MFEVHLTKRAEGEFAELPDILKQKFYKEFEHLSINPFIRPQVKRLQGTENGYRLRIGRWRILFALFLKEKRIEVVDIFMKKGKEDYQKRKKIIKIKSPFGQNFGGLSLSPLF